MTELERHLKDLENQLEELRVLLAQAQDEILCLREAKARLLEELNKYFSILNES